MQRVADFHYELPPELIAQEPLADRTASRMLVVDRKDGSFLDDRFVYFPDYLSAGDCLVVNDSKVIPARLHGKRRRQEGGTGATVELFLLRSDPNDQSLWTVLARPGKRVWVGDWIEISADLGAEIVAQGDRGERKAKFHCSSGPLEDALDRAGRIPLPPYIHREAGDQDVSRYQTVFARERGSVAAPTAGLHFTPEVLQACRDAGAEIASVTLHVGLGTFKSIESHLDLAAVQLHSERFDISDENKRRIQSATRRVCIGTTSVRALESALSSDISRGETNLFISPGFSFRGTDAMLTNFHLPASSLLILVSAFAGKELVLRAYEHAVRERYRFFSYGDCMLII